MITSLSIKQLFGLYDYQIDLLLDDNMPLKFITGPNGYGKSTILRMINSMLRRDWSDFLIYEFAELNVFFDFGNVNIMRTVTEREVDLSSDQDAEKDIALDISYSNAQGQILSSIRLVSQNGSETQSADGDYPDMLNMDLSNVSHYFIRDSRSHVIVDADGISHADSDVTYVNRKDFINRLNDAADVISRVLRDTDMRYDNLLTLENYNTLSADLKPFVERLNEMELTTVAFPEYDSAESPQLTNIITAFGEIRRILGDFVERVTLLEELVRRSRFSYKKMIVKKPFGFLFLMQNEEETPIDAEQLSSGEQHMLIQTYEMLFKTEKGAVVLIDEPEMSYHLAWQIGYLNYIKRLMDNRNIQCIIATHSSQIFQRKWELSCDLYELHKNHNQA